MAGSDPAARRGYMHPLHTRVSPAIARAAVLSFIIGLAAQVGCLGDEIVEDTPECFGRPLVAIADGQTVVEGELRGADLNWTTSCSLKARGPEQAYSFTLAEPARVSFHVDAPVEMAIAIRRACIEGEEVTCGRVGVETGHTWSKGLEAGDYVMVLDAVGSHGAAGGRFRMHISKGPPDPGSICTSPEPIGDGVDQSINLAHAQASVGMDDKSAYRRFFEMSLAPGQRVRAVAAPMRGMWQPALQLRAGCDEDAEILGRGRDVGVPSRVLLALDYTNTTEVEQRTILEVSAPMALHDAAMQLNVDVGTPLANESCAHAVEVAPSDEVYFPSGQILSDVEGCPTDLSSWLPKGPSLFYKIIVPPGYQFEEIVDADSRRLFYTVGLDCSFNHQLAMKQNDWHKPRAVYLKVTSCWPQVLPQQIGFSLGTKLEPIPRACPDC